MLINKRLIMVGLGCLLLPCHPAFSREVNPGDDLQAVLNRGDDLVLAKGKMYEITQTLTCKKPGQKIYTKNARFPSEYATLRLVNPEEMMILNASCEGGLIEKVVFDGDRYHISVVPKPKIGGGGQPALVRFGGHGGDGMAVRDCVFMNTRTWSTLKMQQGAEKLVAENNLFLGAGVDPRGNGRDLNEEPFAWADAISCASSNSVIRNNLIIDPTDVGVVLYAAAGTVVEDNVVAAISRESMGGVNMVDKYQLYALNEEKTLISYRGVKVRNNMIDAFGGRIHMMLPVGCVVWVPHWRGNILTGGEVTGNILDGGAGGYGIVAHGITDWKIIGNISKATYSGLAEYGEHPNPPDDPAAFLYDAPSVIDCTLQPEFVPAKRHIEHLLRTQFAPEDANGYQMHDYGEPEGIAVVKAAYLEMLGRAPNRQEVAEGIKLLASRKLNADGLRRQLMTGVEFKKYFGEVEPEELHPFRVKLWFDICDKLIRKNGGMPSAVTLYKEALDELGNK
ncbi:right-handed parallel beta-helix repeat-containing protein [Pontiella sulfatireligans]|nr:right-handed parallel beta-helix repeat-containing protein [Pontiella sulfatireligans]